MKKPFQVSTSLLALLAMAASVHAASAAPASAPAGLPASAQRPVTTPRVGGSPADEAFRDAQRESGARYRESLADCTAKPKAARSACRKEARAALKSDHESANKAHAAAQKAAH